MPLKLEEISPKFRALTDLLLFTDRVDLDLANFKQLLRENHLPHLRYLLDRFEKSADIAWENGDQFWHHRFSFLFSLNERGITNTIEKFLDERFIWLLKAKPKIHPHYDLEYLQYLQYCKVKRERKENLLIVRRNLVECANYCSTEKLIGLIHSFIPDAFKDINEYVKLISQRLTYSVRYLDVLRSLEKKGVEFDKSPLVMLAKEILLIRSYSERNCRALFALLNDPVILSQIKETYSPTYRKAFLEILTESDYHRIEEYHLRNVKNILELDISLADEIIALYADKLYARSVRHKRANITKLIRLLKRFPACSPKQLLGHMSGRGMNADLRTLMKEFPDLEIFGAFI
jgi:hypothetical protein